MKLKLPDFARKNSSSEPIAEDLRDDALQAYFDPALDISPEIHASGEVLAETGETKRTTTNVSKAEFPDSIYCATKEQWVIVGCVALAANLSTISIPIYFPVLDVMAKSFNTTVERINLTATMYSLFQGISPIFWASMSDAWGRRPIYFSCIAIYIGACIGLALAPNYWTLFGLRILQAFGVASTVSMSGGVVGDISNRRTRGGLIGISSGVGLLGNCFGPLIGGGLEARWSTWRAIFWFLVILASVVLVLIAIFLPETNRHLVGDGSRQPRQWLSKSPYGQIRQRVKGVPYPVDSPHYDEQWSIPPAKIHWFRWTELFFQPDVLLVLFPTAIHYTTWYMVLTAQSTVLSQYYGFTALDNGYTYLASGIGTFGGSFLSGRLLQWNYRRLAVKSAPDRPDIYHARLDFAFPSTAMMVASVLVFGWTLHFHVSFYVPVIMTFFVSLAATNFLSMASSLLVDLFPDDSAASQSCNNLARCCLCAGGIAVVQTMMRTMTIGGCFTFLAAICAVSCLCIYIELHFGDRLAGKRLRKIQSRSHK